jgi:hypothetical protein
MWLEVSGVTHDPIAPAHMLTHTISLAVPPPTLAQHSQVHTGVHGAMLATTMSALSVIFSGIVGG